MLTFEDDIPTPSMPALKASPETSRAQPARPVVAYDVTATGSPSSTLHRGDAVW